MKNKKGFSLVEILVVIAIVVIVGSVGLASFNTLTNQKRLESETKKVSDVLQLAKQKASSVSVTDALLCSGSTPYIGGYQVKFDASSYGIYVFCVDNISSPATIVYPPTELSTYKIDSRIIIANAPFDINFTTLSKGATSNVIQLKNTNTSKYKCVSVNVLGTIEEVTPCP